MTIGAASRLSGVPCWQLRRWEQSGLLTPPRSPSGYRLYRAADIEEARALKLSADSGDRLSLFAPALQGLPRSGEQVKRTTASVGGTGDLATIAEDVTRWAVAVLNASWGAIVMSTDDGLEAAYEVLTVVGRTDLRGYKLDPEECRVWQEALRHDATIESPGLASLLPGASIAAPLRLTGRSGAIVFDRERNHAIGELVRPIEMVVEHALARTRLNQDNAKLQRSATSLRTLVGELSLAADKVDVGVATLNSVFEMLEADVGMLSLVDRSRLRYEIVAHRGLSDRYIDGVDAWTLDEGIVGRAFASREPVVVPDLQDQMRPTRLIVRREGLRSMLVVPMLNRGRMVGIVEVFSRVRRRFDQLDIDNCMAACAAASLAVIALEGELRNARLSGSQRELLSGWSRQTQAEVERERDTLRATLQAEVLGTIRSGAPASATVHALETIIEQLGAPIAARNDLVTALGEELVPRLRSKADRAIEFVVIDHPTKLTPARSARLLPPIATLLQLCADAAAHDVQLSVSETEDNCILLRISDDRWPPSVNPAATVPADVANPLAALGASITAGPTDIQFTNVIDIVLPLHDDERLASLTNREMTVLQALADGESNRQIAERLAISPKTLQNHITRIYRKLGVSNRIQAALAVQSLQSR